MTTVNAPETAQHGQARGQDSLRAPEGPEEPLDMPAPGSDYDDALQRSVN